MRTYAEGDFCIINKAQYDQTCNVCGRQYKAVEGIRVLVKGRVLLRKNWANFVDRNFYIKSDVEIDRDRGVKGVEYIKDIGKCGQVCTEFNLWRFVSKLGTNWLQDEARSYGIPFFRPKSSEVSKGYLGDALCLARFLMFKSELERKRLNRKRKELEKLKYEAESLA